jgi:hypothetical protein
VKGRGMKNVLVCLKAALASSLMCAPVVAQQGSGMSGNLLMGTHVPAFKRFADGKGRGTEIGDATYLVGFASGVAFALGKVDPLVCLPSTVNAGQMTLVFVQHMEANPAELHRPADSLAIEAFRKAFSCRRP